MVVPVEAGLVARRMVDRDVVERGPVRTAVSSGTAAVRRGVCTTAAVGLDMARDAVAVGVPVAAAGAAAGGVVARVVADAVLEGVPGPADVARMGADAAAGRARRAVAGGAGGGWGGGWSRFARFRTAWEA